MLPIPQSEVWEKNMTVCHKPSITANREAEDYTQAGKSTILPYEKVLKWPQTGVRWFIFHIQIILLVGYVP